MSFNKIATNKNTKSSEIYFLEFGFIQSTSSLYYITIVRRMYVLYIAHYLPGNCIMEKISLSLPQQPLLFVRRQQRRRFISSSLSVMVPAFLCICIFILFMFLFECFHVGTFCRILDQLHYRLAFPPFESIPMVSS